MDIGEWSGGVPYSLPARSSSKKARLGPGSIVLNQDCASGQCVHNRHSRALRLAHVVGRIRSKGQNDCLGAFGDIVNHRVYCEGGRGDAGWDGDELRHVALLPAIVRPLAGGASELIVYRQSVRGAA